MGTGKRPKGGSGKEPMIHATNLAVANGQTERGWKAGALHGVNGHRTFAHQPCIDDYTDGALKCPYCATGQEVVWRGYVPVWDRDWCLRYAIVGKDVEESVDCIQRGEPVSVSRAKSMRSPLIVRPEQNTFRALPDKAPYNAEVCMEDICLLLWKLPVLALWVRTSRSKSDKPLSLTPTAKKELKKSDGKPFSPEYRNAAMRYGQGAPTESEELIAAAERDILAKVQAAGKNGSHKNGKAGS